MTQKQEAALLAIADVIRDVANVNGVPDYPPEQIPEDYYPFVITYPGNGTHSFGAQGESVYLGEIVVELHVARIDLPLAVQSALEFGDTIPKALMQEMITGTTLQGVVMDTFSEIVQTFGELNWGAIQTLGYRFIINGVKIRTDLS